MGEMRGAHWVLVARHEGKRLLGKPRHRCDDKIGVKYVGGIDWFDMARERDCKRFCICGNERFGYIKCEEFLD